MEFNYEAYKKHTIVKLIFMSIGLAIPVILICFVLPHFEADIKNDLKVIRWIVLAFFEAAIVYKLYKYIRIIINADYAKDYYIKLNDERQVFIRQKSSTFTLKLLLYCLALGAIVAGFYNSYVFYTLLLVIGFIVVSNIIITIFYNKKF